ncbi:MAG: YXWGXW repeat-containing protein [Acidobacteriaceae bacterium]|nr:YXWGXW repeat-containing protein [Acidobacteriaceae bacterium]
MNKMASTALLGAALAVGSANAQVYVRVAPPPPQREVITIRPGPKYVWTGGYYRWNSHAYVWVPGHWVVPPRAGVAWVPGHWVHRTGGWVWVAGYWR